MRNVLKEHRSKSIRQIKTQVIIYSGENKIHRLSWHSVVSVPLCFERVIWLMPLCDSISKVVLWFHLEGGKEQMPPHSIVLVQLILSSANIKELFCFLYISPTRGPVPISIRITQDPSTVCCFLPQQCVVSRVELRCAVRVTCVTFFGQKKNDDRAVVANFTRRLK